MDYRFVKIKRKNNDTAHWYFNPRTKEQVIEHFNKIFGSEIKDGVRDFMHGIHVKQDPDNPEKQWIYHEHPSTPWARAVEVYQNIYGGTWIENATKLENETINQRINSFNSGKDMYLDNGVVETRLCEDDEIVEEIFESSLKYPIETQMRLDEVRYMKWDMPDLNIKGTHWYAKIGKFDIVDKNGNMKWDTKEEAEHAAEWFIKNNVSCDAIPTFRLE